jgi:hypothetical protein
MRIPFTPLRFCAILLFCSTAGITQAEDAPGDKNSAADEVQRVADHIDDLIAKRWKGENITPAEPASDAEFIRRLSLHLNGSIPPVSRAREYLSDPSPDKHRRLVEEILEGPGYVVNFTSYWRRVMLPETDSDLQTRFLIPGFESWLRDRLTENTPYDQIAKQIINVQLTQNANTQRT